MTTRLKIQLWTMGMRQRDLADLTGLSETTISNAVIRDKASRETQVKISEALGVDQSELFNKEG